MSNVYDRARLYAFADKSDPFAYSRAVTHIRSGLALGDDGYSAEPTKETRQLPDGTSYQATVYHNVRRP